MIKSIPSTWDETIVLPPSSIGQIVAFARRKGSTWFIAVNNGTEAHKIRLGLSFLSKVDYQAQLVSDQKGNPAAVVIKNAKMNRSDFLDLDLTGGGGFIARFTPAH
jgi:alpha-glucosidase